MILVYEYVACGTLADHLYQLAKDNNNSSSLTWKQRLNICIGSGRALDYLHTGHRVIHRDVKASNILLDENFKAKVSDFGLAKPEDRNKLQSHVSTNVKGTFGPAVASRHPEDERILTKWARDKISKGEVNQIVASSLKEEISSDSMRTFVGIAERCLCDEPKKRPTMSQVVLQLEFALGQQENKQLLVPNEIASASDDIDPCNDDHTNLLANTGQRTMVSTDVQSLTPLLKGQTNNVEPASARKDKRKATTYNPSRLWLWATFWNRIKPSKKNELSSSEILEVNVQLPHFDWATIAAATNHFSSSNKVGCGGFNTVYKGVLPTGQVVAVKRLSTNSGQGLEEFKNGIILLHNLQHRNIIKLLGYCIHREEKLSVYEFMENKSLDTFIGWFIQNVQLFSSDSPV
ncbi:hypothetical protein BUALT_BualtUnG0013400 [Buddleja alternifolia]|uniref:non-specific serine/threonine protein kinase n=1 Tax=Buddleja alternifolia TaxID=168488 RepID=A0AAV6W156_9LAMI|nr:hypothetical protein BUALT_BualtUnG0013400 [Buddleja alternifolia]